MIAHLPTLSCKVCMLHQHGSLPLTPVHCPNV